MPEIANVVGGNIITDEWGNLIRSRTVQRYATKAARTAAHPSPTEGDLAYLQDSNEVEVFNGTTWVGISAAAVQMGIAYSITGTPTLTASFADAVTTTFTPPSGWATYQLMTSARFMANATVGGSGTTTRVGIGGAYGPEIVFSGPAASGGVFLGWNHHIRTGLTGASIVNLQGKLFGSGGSDINNSDISYTAVRTT